MIAMAPVQASAAAKIQGSNIKEMTVIWFWKGQRACSSFCSNCAGWHQNDRQSFSWGNGFGMQCGYFFKLGGGYTLIIPLVDQAKILTWLDFRETSCHLLCSGYRWDNWELFIYFGLDVHLELGISTHENKWERIPSANCFRDHFAASGAVTSQLQIKPDALQAQWKRIASQRLTWNKDASFKAQKHNNVNRWYQTLFHSMYILKFSNDQSRTT